MGYRFKSISIILICLSDWMFRMLVQRRSKLDIIHFRVIFDQTLSMQIHMNTIARACFHYMKTLLEFVFSFWGGMHDNCSCLCDFKVIYYDILMYGLQNISCGEFKIMQFAWYTCAAWSSSASNRAECSFQSFTLYL